jgi:hypothetical protein
MNKIELDIETIQARARIVKALKTAIAEAKNLNRMLDHMHDALEINRTKNAA